MKITKDALKRLIKEELAELQEQRVDREAEADADVRQSIARAAKHAAHQAERGLSQARAMADPRYAQEKRAAGYKTIADKAKDDPRRKKELEESFQDVLAEDDTMDPMGADEFSRFANVPGYEDERVPGKTASQVRRRDLPPEEFKYDDSHLRDLGYLEEIIREETEAVLAESDAMKKKTIKSAWESYCDGMGLHPTDQYTGENLPTPDWLDVKDCNKRRAHARTDKEGAIKRR